MTYSVIFVIPGISTKKYISPKNFHARCNLNLYASTFIKLKQVYLL